MGSGADNMKEDEEGWIEWSGGDCPVNGDVAVDYKLRNECDFFNRFARNLRWDALGGDDDIVAYRLSQSSERVTSGKTIATNQPVRKVSDGSTADYYQLPNGCTELQDLISHKDMNAQIGEIFRECYRYGEAEHCDKLRGIKKIIFYANAELKRLLAQ